MTKLENIVLSSGVVVILVTNLIGAIQHSPSWLFSGIVVGLVLCAASYVLSERRRIR